MRAYRLIYYVPDHARQARFPIAVALSDRGALKLVEAEPAYLPDSRCLGGKTQAALLYLVRQALRSLTSFEQLPVAVGPHGVLGEVRALPAGVDDPELWLLTHVLQPAGWTTHGPSRRVDQQRATYGLQFFRRWGVHDLIRKRFQPRNDLSGWLAGASDTLKPVSHWVAGRSSVLFMEPLVPTRTNFKSDIRELGSAFWAYRAAIHQVPHPFDLDAELVAYVLKGGSERDRAYASDALRGPADHVVDTSRDAVAEQFITRVRQLALSSQQQGEL